LIATLILAQIRTLDHVIVGPGDQSFSFADSGLMVEYQDKIEEVFKSVGLLS